MRTLRTWFGDECVRVEGDEVEHVIRRGLRLVGQRAIQHVEAVGFVQP